MRKLRNDRIGERRATNEGEVVEIIKYKNKKDCSVQFINSDVIIENLEYSAVKDGRVKNPYRKTTHGIGYLGQGNYKAWDNSKKSHFKNYIVWKGMLERCYDKKIQEKHPTYKGCSVDEIWHNFQVFARWFEENYVEDFHLDKDILIKSNKIYSPETCTFVPREINNILNNKLKSRGELPIGVQKSGNKFQASISVFKLKIHLGTFNTIEEAFQAYKIAKEKYIKEMADKWKNQITEPCYQALIKYTVEITD